MSEYVCIISMPSASGRAARGSPPHTRQNSRVSSGLMRLPPFSSEYDMASSITDSPSDSLPLNASAETY